VPLQLDTAYIPKAQDKTLAIGYPSVGADTITQTVGVVAGTQQYNDATYIKTDAAISPGNSG
jgi:S1-C subfamily serine protease